MDWRLKAAVQAGLSLLPERLGTPLYTALQRRAGGLRRPDPMQRLRRLPDLLGRAREAGATVLGRSGDGASVLEIGTGWGLALPIGMHLAGAASVTTVDVRRFLLPDYVAAQRAALRRDEAAVRALFADLARDGLADPAVFDARWQALVAPPGIRSPERWNERDAPWLRYLAPADARALPPDVTGFDLVVSVSVFEHIPPGVLGAILRETTRRLAPSGVQAHVVDTSDHFAHADARRSALHFLRHSPGAWRAIAGNRFAYCNRLRPSDLLDLADAAGLDVTALVAEVPPRGLAEVRAGLPVHSSFARYAEDDLAATALTFAGIARPPRQTPGR